MNARMLGIICALLAAMPNLVLDWQVAGLFA